MRSVADANRLAEENIGLAYRCASKWTWTGFEYDDLVSNCLLALVYASRCYNPDRGVQFSTYAYRTMCNALHRMVESRKSSKRDPRRTQPLQRSKRFTKQIEDRRYGTCQQVDRLIEARETVPRLMEPLNDRERWVLVNRVVDGHQLKQLGAVLGVCTESVRRTEIRALAKCRERAGVAA